jgi:hypothetical protein
VHLKVFYALVHDKVPRPAPLQARDERYETDKTHKQADFRILAGVAPNIIEGPAPSICLLAPGFW